MLQLKKEGNFEKFRAAEVKHGRVAMLAIVGHITAASGARFGGELANGVKFTEIEGSGYKALSQLAPADLLLILFTAGFLEMRVMKVVPGTPAPYMPGDLRNGLFTETWDSYSEATKKEKINKELNNGRAAMMGITGLMVHEAIGGAQLLPCGTSAVGVVVARPRACRAPPTVLRGVWGLAMASSAAARAHRLLDTRVRSPPSCLPHATPALTCAPLALLRCAVDPYIGTGIDWRLDDITATFIAAGSAA